MEYETDESLKSIVGRPKTPMVSRMFVYIVSICFTASKVLIVSMASSPAHTRSSLRSRFPRGQIAGRFAHAQRRSYRT